MAMQGDETTLQAMSPSPDAQQQAQISANKELWELGLDWVRQYANRDLRAVEVMLLIRYRDVLRGRVLELGCGAGRVTSYLAAISDHVQGLDVSPKMLEYCRQAYPNAEFREGDLRDLSAYEDGSIDVIMGPGNILDVLTDDERQDVLDQLRRVISPEGLLIFSSHNRDNAPQIKKPLDMVHWRNPGFLIRDLQYLPRRLRNRRRRLRHERVEAHYSILNDTSHEFLALHYYISRDDQERQLRDHAFELIECLDLDSWVVAPGTASPNCPELHYVARPI